MNLLKETLQDIKDSGHKPEQIVFIGSEETGHCCSWEEYKILADNTYDASFGAQEVASDLIIVFKDGTKMWRHEYDGSECWHFSSPFTMPKETHPIKSLFVNGIGWETLASIASEEVE